MTLHKMPSEAAELKLVTETASTSAALSGLLMLFRFIVIVEIRPKDRLPN